MKPCKNPSDFKRDRPAAVDAVEKDHQSECAVSDLERRVDLT